MLVKDFPGGTVDKNQPSDAEDMGDPWSRKTPHFARQPSQDATTTEPACLEPVVCNRSPCMAAKSRTHSLELEKACTQWQRPNTAKKKILIFKNASKVVEKLNHLCISEWLPWSMGSQRVGHNWTTFTHTHTHTHTHMHQSRASQVALWKRICLPALEMQERWILSLGWEEPLKKEMAAHSSIHPWIIPKTKEPGGLQSTGLQKIRTRLSD